MKFSALFSPRLAGALALFTAASASAVPLPATTAVQSRPEANAPVLGYLKAGTEPTPAAEVAPEGWMAVTLPGPFEAYVQNRDLLKSLDVKPGSPLYLEPKLGAAVLALALQGDQIEITGLRGKWTQVRLTQAVTGYIATGPLPPAVPITPLADLTPPPAGQGPGHPVDSGATAGHDGPRLLEGTLTSAHRAFHSPPPFDWQIVDAAGNRVAYVDVSKLLLTEQIDALAGRAVRVSGLVQALAHSTDLVIAAESLTLK